MDEIQNPHFSAADAHVCRLRRCPYHVAEINKIGIQRLGRTWELQTTHRILVFSQIKIMRIVNGKHRMDEKPCAAHSEHSQQQMAQFKICLNGNVCQQHQNRYHAHQQTQHHQYFH